MQFICAFFEYGHLSLLKMHNVHICNFKWCVNFTYSMICFRLFFVHILHVHCIKMVITVQHDSADTVVRATSFKYRK